MFLLLLRLKASDLNIQSLEEVNLIIHFMIHGIAFDLACMICPEWSRALKSRGEPVGVSSWISFDS